MIRQKTDSDGRPEAALRFFVLAPGDLVQHSVLMQLDAHEDQERGDDQSMRDNADERQHARDFEHERARLQHIELAALARVVIDLTFHDSLP